MASSSLLVKRKRSDMPSLDEPKQSIGRPACAICIQPYVNQTFLQPCFHAFCFQCIKQWINITPICPLCKQGIDSLIYDVDEENESFQEYTLHGHEFHDPPSGRPRQTLWARFRPQRTQVYRTAYSQIVYPPARYPSLQFLTPDKSSKAAKFIEHELQAISGSTDVMLLRHVMEILLVPYERSTSRKRNRREKPVEMDDPGLINELAEWLTVGLKEASAAEKTRIARRFVQELMAYLRSGVDYWTFVANAKYIESRSTN